jgi:hypothetical protein
LVSPCYWLVKAHRRSILFELRPSLDERGLDSVLN